MATSQLAPAALARAVAFLSERYRPLAIVLYGSLVSEPRSVTSDVDLGVLFGGRVPDGFDRAAARTELEDILGRCVDLVALDGASPILRMEVLRRHQMLLNRDPERFEAFVVRTLQEYFDLKRVREPIERALLSSDSR